MDEINDTSTCFNVHRLDELTENKSVPTLRPVANIYYNIY